MVNYQESARVYAKTQVYIRDCWRPDTKLSPCENACPAGVNISKYILAIGAGQFAEAGRIIREELPFPAICGRVCHHPCESVCNRGKIDDPLAIRALKKFVADWELRNLKEEKKVLPVGERAAKVAIIGAGPAGLTAAYFLRKLCYRVTVYEKNTTPGGIITQAIPDFILPKKVAQDELQKLLETGVEIQTGVKVGKNIGLADFRRKGFGAVLIATGAHKPRSLKIPGVDLAGVQTALDFLKEVKELPVRLRGSVVVIGGGNVALDAARSAIRLGAEKVDLACIESRKAMPAFDWEIESAEQEGVKIHNLVVPEAIMPVDSAAKQVIFKRIKSFDVTEDGKITWDVLDSPAARLVLSAQTILIAVGQDPDLGVLGGMNVKTTEGRIQVDPSMHTTSETAVFAAGDVVTGRGTVVEAIAAGKRAAFSIHRYLSGQNILQKMKNGQGQVFLVDKKAIPEFLSRKRRWEVPEIPKRNRVRYFGEVELGYSLQEAVEEARRCLNCGMCGNCIFMRGQLCYDRGIMLL